MNRGKDRNRTENREEHAYPGHIGHHLVLHNDDVHSFEYVIKALMEVCDHSAVQAEQCATLTHYHGKCSIKIGLKDEIIKMKAQLSELGLETSVELVKTS